MTPIILSLQAFRLFDIAITKTAKPFSPHRILAEFSSLVEMLTLYERIEFFNIGAFPFEWETGKIIPRDKSQYNPFKPFYGLNFIGPASMENFEKFGRKEILKEVPKEQKSQIIAQEFKDEPYHDFTLGSYLGLFHQAYSGWWGPVAVKSFPLINNIIDKVFMFEGSKHSVANDPLIIQAYEKLKSTYSTKVDDLLIKDISPISIPPITAILLSRLPDNVSDPFLVVQEILNLREELKVVRNGFENLENIYYDDNSSLNDFKEVQCALEKNSKVFAQKFGMQQTENIYMQWFLDKVSTLTKWLIKKEVEPDEIVDLLASVIPMLPERLNKKVPLVLSNMALDSLRIPGYRALVHKKLGLQL